MLDINKNKPIIFEDGKPFSECALWDMQRDFFVREGVNAWDHQVPFYITSNPSIANSTAQMLLRFLGLLDKLPACSDVIMHALKAGMPRIAANFYYMPGAFDTLSGIALFFQEIEDYDQALVYYQQSLSHYGEADHVCYNIGLCHYYRGDLEQAINQFECALQLNPELNCARQWLNKTTMPLMRQANL